MIRIGIICPSEIAFRRFMPALQNCKELEYGGIAFASAEEWFGGKVSETPDSEKAEMRERELGKAMTFKEQYGGKIYEGYHTIIESPEIDAIYVPLPPALHYQWAKLALLNGKHVLVEKPSTDKLTYTQELITLASERKLALHENYMFMFHNQIEEIRQIVTSGEIGDVRLYRIDFGFPRRSQNDFRYNKKLGGGALLDAGGYTFKLANYLLGGDAHIESGVANYIPDFEVEIFGAATLKNGSGKVAQVAFGMDNDYRCRLEVWGSQGTLTADRVLTAPAGFVPEYQIKKNQDITIGQFTADDTFSKSIKYFVECIVDSNTRKCNYKKLIKQQTLVSEFIELSNMKLS